MKRKSTFAGTERFEVLSRLGVGGTGIVYEAYDHERNSRVALKKLRTPTPDALLRFKSEFRVLEQLQHPNLVMLGELIEHEGEWFFTMELVEGVDFVTWVRGDGGDREGFDEHRLRAALAQLASAIAALHAAGKVHRDVKPSNTCISREGHLSLLDMGLVTDIERDTLPAHFAVAGTAAYMAPEQAAGGVVGPEADWYGLGVLLYQSLTGQLPFEGTALEVMSTKQEREPAAASTRSRGVPPDLDRLCSELLKLSPDDRPPAEVVMRRLHGAAGGPYTTITSTPAVPFLGREPQLQSMRVAYNSVAKHGCLTVLVEGESGVGKSALVHRFAERLLAGEDPPVIFSGRVHQRESVPYKAFDTIVDKLSRYLNRLPRAEAEAMMPRWTSLLAQVFPVLRRVEAVAEAPRPRTEPVEEQERRGRVFEALRDVFVRIAQHTKLVLVIDDLQWTDPDSVALLRELLQPLEAPRMLLVATVRTSAHSDDPLMELPGRVQRLQLDALPSDDGRRLARLCAEQHGHDAAREIGSDAIADEARGHPLFILELVRHAVLHPGGRRSGQRLEEAVWSRIRLLDAAVRRLLQIVVVAGGPLVQEVARKAAEARDATEFAHWMSTLRNAHLVRTTGVRGADSVEPYHDRVRAAVLMHIAPEVRAICHRRLAVSLEGTRDADPETLAIHWQNAFDDKSAARHALVAARQADEAMAFDRAARLYQMALDLGKPEGARRCELLTALGVALSDAGRGPDAAVVFLEGAALSSEAEALELRRRSAGEYLRSGHIIEGRETLAQVLRAVGMRMPKTPTRALASLLWTRARVRLRGLRFRERDERSIPPKLLTRVDTCWSVGSGLALVDPIRGSDFQARQLLFALKTGEPFRVSRALAAEASFAVTDGGKALPRAQTLLAASAAVCARVDDPRANAFLELARGVVCYLTGGWKEAYEHCALSEKIVRDQCFGMAWELFNARYFQVLALFWMGELGEFCKRVPVMQRAADERGDRLAASIMRNGLVAMYPCIIGDPQRAIRESSEVIESVGDEFQFQHYWEMIAVGDAELYQGNGAAALAAVRRAWRGSERSMILRMQYVRLEAMWLRSRALLGAATSAPASERGALYSEAARFAKKIEGEGMAWALPMAQAIRAAIAYGSGDYDEAIAGLRRCSDGFEAADMSFFGSAARRMRGVLVGGDEGAADVEIADEWMRQQSIESPENMTAVYMPGFSLQSN